MKNKIKKLIAYFSLSLAFILIISGATGYLIMGSEGDPESAIKLVEKELSKSAHADKKESIKQTMMRKLILQEVLK